MTTPLSTGRERRVATMVSANRVNYRISSSASGGSIWARNRRKADRRVDEDMRAVAQDLIDGHTHCAADCGANRIVLAIRRTLDPILVEAEP